MSKPRKGSSARNVIKIGSGRKQRKKSKQLLKNIVDEFNQETPMRGLGDTGHLGGEW
jgi:hypothetical protein